MIVTQDVVGTIDPIEFALTYQGVDNRRIVPYDVSKLTAQWLQNYQLTNSLEQATDSQTGTIRVQATLRDNQITGSFVGENIYGLNESIPRVCFCSGDVTGLRVANRWSLKLTGVVENIWQQVGAIDSVIQIRSNNAGITNALALVSSVIDDTPLALTSTTTDAVPDTTYYRKSNTVSMNYFWRESVDRELLIAREQLLGASYDQYIDTVRAPYAVRTFGYWLKNNPQLKAQDYKLLWRSLGTLNLLGTSTWGFEQCLANFSEQPPIITLADYNTFVLGEAVVGVSSVSTLLESNTVIVDYTTNRIQPNPRLLQLFLAQLKPIHQKWIIKTKDREPLII